MEILTLLQHAHALARGEVALEAALRLPEDAAGRSG